MGTLTPRDLKVLRNVTGIKENLTPHTQETLAPNEMCVGHVWTSDMSFRRDSSCFSKVASLHTAHPRYVLLNPPVLRSLSHTPRLTDGFFSMREKLDISQRLVLDYASMFWWQEHDAKTAFIWRAWEDVSIYLSHKAFNWELTGVNHSSLWAEECRRAGRGETWPF